MDEDVTLTVTARTGVLVNDCAPADQSTPLEAVLLTDVANGTLNLNPSWLFSYPPHPDFSGEDSFTYEIRAEDGTAETGVATISVAGINVAHVAVPTAFATEFGTAIVADVPGLLDGVADADGDTLTAALETAPENGTVTIGQEGSFSYTPDAAFAGEDSVAYTISDGNGGTETAIAGIERVFVSNDSGTRVFFDFSDVTGEQEVWADRNISPSDSVFLNLGTGTVVGVLGDRQDTNGRLPAAYADPDEPVSPAFDGGVIQAPGQAAIDPNDSRAASATIPSTGAANLVGGIGLGTSLTALRIVAETDLTIDEGVDSAVQGVTLSATQEIFGFAPDGTENTIIVTGPGRMDLGDISGNVQVIDASASTGGLSLGSLVNDAAGAGAGRLVLVRAGDGTDPIGVDGTSLTGFEIIDSRGGVLVDLAGFEEATALILSEDGDQDSGGDEGGFPTSRSRRRSPSRCRRPAARASRSRARRTGPTTSCV